MAFFVQQVCLEKFKPTAVIACTLLLAPSLVCVVYTISRMSVRSRYVSKSGPLR